MGSKFIEVRNENKLSCVNYACVYGELITEVEYRSTSSDGNDLYEFTINTINKSSRGGRVRVTGESKLSIVIDSEMTKIENMDNLSKGSSVKIEGFLIQDKIEGLGTTSIYATIVEEHEVQEFDINYVKFEGKLKKDVAVKEIDENTVRVNLLLTQEVGGISPGITIYTSMWNNLANRVIDMDLKIGDVVVVSGNPISRKYSDNKSGNIVELAEVLCKKVSVVSRAPEVQEIEEEDNSESEQEPAGEETVEVNEDSGSDVVEK